MRIVDRSDGVAGWLDDGERMRRTSHALESGGRVWLFDVVDWPGLDDLVAELGEPAGVVQLLDRHGRDCAAVARRLGVPYHVVPRELPGTPFELRQVVRSRWWREAALWWPDRRLLLVADALGTIAFFRAGDEPAGLHPMLRLRPPRALCGLEPERLLVGHGESLDGQPGVVAEALKTGRRRIPRWLAGLPRAVGEGYRHCFSHGRAGARARATPTSHPPPFTGWGDDGAEGVPRG